MPQQVHIGREKHYLGMGVTWVGLSLEMHENEISMHHFLEYTPEMGRRQKDRRCVCVFKEKSALMCGENPWGGGDF
jgi:hypothetical protein